MFYAILSLERKIKIFKKYQENWKQKHVYICYICNMYTRRDFIKFSIALGVKACSDPNMVLSHVNLIY